MSDPIGDFNVNPVTPYHQLLECQATNTAGNASYIPIDGDTHSICRCRTENGHVPLLLEADSNVTRMREQEEFFDFRLHDDRNKKDNNISVPDLPEENYYELFTDPIPTGSGQNSRVLSSLTMISSKKSDAALIHSLQQQQQPILEDWASNILFLVGSILYVWVAIWDVIKAYNGNVTGIEDDDKIYDDDNFGDYFDNSSIRQESYYSGGDTSAFIRSNAFSFQALTETRKSSWRLSPYVLLSALAASCYLIDSLFQVCKLMCNHRQQQEQYHRLSTGHPNNCSHNDCDNRNSSNDDTGQNDHQFYYNHSHIPLMENATEQQERNHGSQYCQQKKWIVPASIAITFGLAASSELVSSVLIDRNKHLSKILHLMGVHFYLANAVMLNASLFKELAFCQYTCFPINTLISYQNKSENGQPAKSRQYSSSDGLEFFGDLLFLAGSTIDVLITYWGLESTSVTVVSWLSLLSALLWLVDAIFYIAADLIGPEDIRCCFENNHVDEILVASDSAHIEGCPCNYDVCALDQGVICTEGDNKKTSGGQRQETQESWSVIDESENNVH